MQKTHLSNLIDAETTSEICISVTKFTFVSPFMFLGITHNFTNCKHFFRKNTEIYSRFAIYLYSISMILPTNKTLLFFSACTIF